jgi:hypothetical protein
VLLPSRAFALVLLLALPTAGSAASPGAPARPAIVEKCLAAYGGADAVRSAAAFVQEGSVTSTLRTDRGRIGRAYARPTRLRIETSYGKEGEIRVLDGERGWRGGQPVSGPPLSAMALQAARMDVPGLLATPGTRVVERGTWAHEGKSLKVVAIGIGPGLEVEAGIDPDTGRILRTRSASTAPGTPIEFVTTYSDFRKVGATLFAFHERNWANGAATGETILTRIELVKQIDPSLFRP